MSEEENETLETKVALSRLTKQDYLIHCIEQRDYVIDGKNTRVWKVLKQQLDVFIQRFSEIDDISKLGNDELDVLEYMLQIILAIKKRSKINGKFYQGVNKNVDIAFANEKLYEFLNDDKHKAIKRSCKEKRIIQGQQNDYLFRIACFFQRKRLSNEAIHECIIKENKIRCDPILNTAEVKNYSKQLSV